MTNIKNHIIVPKEGKTKVDIEKLIIWALRKQGKMYDQFGVKDHLEIFFDFDFVPEQETPIKYDDIINEFDTEPDIELVMKQDTEQDMESDTKPYTHSNASSNANSDIDTNTSSSMGRAPNNTMLFKNWIEEHKIKKFDTQEFVDAFACITKDKATKILSYQVDKETIRQIGINRFEAMKEIA